MVFLELTKMIIYIQVNVKKMFTSMNFIDYFDRSIEFIYLFIVIDFVSGERLCSEERMPEMLFFTFPRKTWLIFRKESKKKYETT